MGNFLATLLSALAALALSWYRIQSVAFSTHSIFSFLKQCLALPESIFKNWYQSFGYRLHIFYFFLCSEYDRLPLLPASSFIRNPNCPVTFTPISSRKLIPCLTPLPLHLQEWDRIIYSDSPTDVTDSEIGIDIKHRRGMNQNNIIGQWVAQNMNYWQHLHWSILTSSFSGEAFVPDLKGPKKRLLHIVFGLSVSFLGKLKGSLP